MAGLLRELVAALLCFLVAAPAFSSANDRFTAGDIVACPERSPRDALFASRIGLWDGDGNRVKKTVAGITTAYLVDDLNPTGYAQVITET